MKRAVVFKSFIIFSLAGACITSAAFAGDTGHGASTVMEMVENARANVIPAIIEKASAESSVFNSAPELRGVYRIIRNRFVFDLQRLSVKEESGTLRDIEQHYPTWIAISPMTRTLFINPTAYETYVQGKPRQDVVTKYVLHEMGHFYHDILRQGILDEAHSWQLAELILAAAHAPSPNLDIEVVKPPGNSQQNWAGKLKQILNKCGSNNDCLQVRGWELTSDFETAIGSSCKNQDAACFQQGYGDLTQWGRPSYDLASQEQYLAGLNENLCLRITDRGRPFDSETTLAARRDCYKSSTKDSRFSNLYLLYGACGKGFGEGEVNTDYDDPYLNDLCFFRGLEYIRNNRPPQASSESARYSLKVLLKVCKPDGSPYGDFVEPSTRAGNCFAQGVAELAIPQVLSAVENCKDFICYHGRLEEIINDGSFDLSTYEN